MLCQRPSVCMMASSIPLAAAVVAAPILKLWLLYNAGMDPVASSAFSLGIGRSELAVSVQK